MSLMQFRLSWRWWLGKPDGTFIRLRCRLLGHRWRECHDWCCKGKRWCSWCLAPEEAFRV